MHTILHLQVVPESVSVAKNWHKLSESLNFERQIVRSVKDLMLTLTNQSLIDQVWLDVECVNPDNPTYTIQDLLTMMHTWCAHAQCEMPRVTVCVAHDVDPQMLRSLLEINLMSVIVRSDLKLKRQMMECISHTMVGIPHCSVSVITLLSNQPAMFNRSEQRKTNFTYLIPSTPCMIAQQVLLGFCEELRITMDRCEHWMQLLSKLQLPNYRCDVVIIDISVITSHARSSIMDMINCVHTVRRSVAKHSDVKLYVAVGADTDLHTIRQVLKTPGVHGLCPILTQGFDTHDVKLAIQHMCLNEKHIPTLIQKRLHDNKQTAHKKPPVTKLTRRQSEILGLLTVHAASNKVIANRLKISEAAVKSHVTHLLRKFGLRSRTELAVYNPKLTST